MKRTGLIGVALFGACVAFISCATTASSEGSASAAPADDAAATELKEHHRHHHHGGITQFVAMSLDTLGHDEAKRPQIEKIQSDLRTCMKPAREINRALLGVIADGVAAGTIDQSKVDAALTTLTAAATGERECSVSALNALHAVLSPAERAALVDKVDAHWQVWRQINHETTVGAKEKGSLLSQLTEELSLTPDQVEKMSASLGTASDRLNGKFDPKKVEEHLEAFNTAFLADTFDAKNVTANSNAHLATHGATRMAVFYETVTPLLTPEQRTKLSDHLKEHASHQPAVSVR
jgi:Spy/CpxP family protein refolding chaperone